MRGILLCSCEVFRFSIFNELPVHELFEKINTHKQTCKSPDFFYVMCMSCYDRKVVPSNQLVSGIVTIFNGQHNHYAHNNTLYPRSERFHPLLRADISQQLLLENTTPGEKVVKGEILSPIFMLTHICDYIVKVRSDPSHTDCPLFRNRQIPEPFKERISQLM